LRISGGEYGLPKKGDGKREGNTAAERLGKENRKPAPFKKL